MIFDVKMSRRVVVATHGHCFDGLSSAVLFTRLIRHLNPDEPFLYRYHSCGYGPGLNGVDPKLLVGDINAILDFRFSPSKALTWYFDHHVSAFPGKDDRPTYETASNVEPRQMFHDGAYTSCTKLIADIGCERFGLDLEPVRELVRWADMIDSAAFPNAEMAVSRKDPVLQLMTVVEHHGDDAFLTELVVQLLEQPIERVASSAVVKSMFEPIHRGFENYVKLVSDRAKEVRGVVLVDLSDVQIEVAAKFVTYALYPNSVYSVLLSRSKTKCKISIGYNPWAKTARTHNIAGICERHGGGGHPVVGAISMPAHEVETARALAQSIADELGQ